MRRARVFVHQDRVEKFAGPDLQAMAAKYREVHRVSEECGFLAPEVLYADALSGKLVLERMREISSVREAFLDYQRSASAAVASLFSNVGACLARMHQKVKSSEAVPWVPSGKFRERLFSFAPDLGESELREAVLHGDFGFSNVFITRNREIVFLDPCPNYGATFSHWERGPVYVDIGKFIACLEGQVPLRSQAVLKRKRICELQVAFLRGYESVIRQPLDFGAAFGYAYAVSAAQFDQRYGLVSGVPIYALYNRHWKRNYPHAVKASCLRTAGYG